MYYGKSPLSMCSPTHRNKSRLWKQSERASRLPRKLSRALVLVLQRSPSFGVESAFLVALSLSRALSPWPTRIDCEETRPPAHMCATWYHQHRDKLFLQYLVNDGSSQPQFQKLSSGGGPADVDGSRFGRPFCLFFVVRSDYYHKNWSRTLRYSGIEEKVCFPYSQKIAAKFPC